MAVSFSPIKPLLQTGSNASSRIFSYVGLGIGVLLLLCSVQMFINIQQLLKEGSIRKNGFDFISVTKTITNSNMGNKKATLFNQADVADAKAQPFISNVSPLQANDFKVRVSAGGMIQFATDLFLETIDDEFIDTLPPSFKWEPGQQTIPIILSSDFFEIYNVFAPGQSLPQISKETASGIPVYVHCDGQGKSATFVGKIVAFSDRINSVLVPKQFLDWANIEFGEKNELAASRLFIKTTDANNPELLRYFESKNYTVNKDKTLFGRNKMVMQGVVSGLGVFGLMVVVLALMLFSFYLQLLIARSKDNLQLLLLIGYSPKWLSTHVSKRFIPVYIILIVVALALTQLMQWAFHHFIMFDRPELSSMISWVVLLIALLLLVLAIVTNHRMVKGLLYRLY